MTAPPAPIRVAVTTGSRAEFGLLASTLRALQTHPALQLQLVATGTHLLPDTGSLPEIRANFDVVATVEMQNAGEQTGRANDVLALSRGIAGLGNVFEQLNPDVVLLLGDRIEAFAAATAASIGGRITAHIHGGDRAEGVADEAIRHAITKLAHLHFPATPQSAERIIKLGEDPRFVYCVGSPAIDGLQAAPALDDAGLQELNLDPKEPFAIILQHPCGLADGVEASTMTAILDGIGNHATLNQLLLFAPNRDAGRTAILTAIDQHFGNQVGTETPIIENLPRRQWIGLLKRATVLVGNSSAGLIEAADLGVPCVNVGPRQAGREQFDNVVNVDGTDMSPNQIEAAVNEATHLSGPFKHSYGNGATGQRIADILAQVRVDPPSLRKCNQY